MAATTPDLFGEKLISFSRAAKLIPPFRGAHTAPSTIYRWCIDGCLWWQKIGLAPPAAILDATREYFEDQDVIRVQTH